MFTRDGKRTFLPKLTEEALSLGVKNQSYHIKSCNIVQVYFNILSLKQLIKFDQLCTKLF